MILFWLLLYGIIFSRLQGTALAAGCIIYTGSLMFWLFRFRPGKYKLCGPVFCDRNSYSDVCRIFPVCSVGVWNIAVSVIGQDFKILALTEIIVLVCAATAEEIFFRGWMADKTGHMKYGILLVNIVFALAHGVNLNQSILLTLIQVLFAFFMGISFSLIVNLTDSLWPAVWIHCLVNLTAVCCTAQGAGAALVSLILAVLAAGYMLLLTDIEKIEGKKGENYETVH